MTLFINCCPRGESRTERLARALLKALGEYEELRLYDEPLHPLGYAENIYVTGIVTKYSEAGEPVGLCRASELYYVTTSGRPFDGRFGYDYWKTIAQDCFGIPTVKLLEAENLDIVGADAEKIVDDAIKACGPA